MEVTQSLSELNGRNEYLQYITAANKVNFCAYYNIPSSNNPQLFIFFSLGSILFICPESSRIYI